MCIYVYICIYVYKLVRFIVVSDEKRTEVLLSCSFLTLRRVLVWTDQEDGSAIG